MLTHIRVFNQSKALATIAKYLQLKTCNLMQLLCETQLQMFRYKCYSCCPIFESFCILFSWLHCKFCYLLVWRCQHQSTSLVSRCFDSNVCIKLSLYLLKREKKRFLSCNSIGSCYFHWKAMLISVICNRQTTTTSYLVARECSHR